jgi:hypothetical protein
MSHRLPPMIQGALEATGLPWEIVWGTKHRKVMVNGRFAALLPLAKIKDRDRANRNVVADIRKTARLFEVIH